MSVQGDKFKEIADALRRKTKTEDLIPAKNFATVIDGLELGVTPTGVINVTENGTYDVTNYANAAVNVDVGVTPTGTLNITENGTYDVTNYANVIVNIATQNQSFQNIRIYNAGRVVTGGNTIGDCFYRLNGGEWTQLSKDGTIVILNDVQKLEVYGDGGEVLQQVCIYDESDTLVYDSLESTGDDISWGSDEPYDVTSYLKDGYKVGVISDD